MTPELEFLLRLFCAAVLGGIIGLEREYRSKEAGFRTHFLVALGSALFMIVSAYGFSDAMDNELRRWDVSRVAAQVVSGIGFIGAGTIIFRKTENMVSGLTTAKRSVGDSSHRSCLWRGNVYPRHRQYADGAHWSGGFQLLPP